MFHSCGISFLLKEPLQYIIIGFSVWPKTSWLFQHFRLKILLNKCVQYSGVKTVVILQSDLTHKAAPKYFFHRKAFYILVKLLPSLSERGRG